MTIETESSGETAGNQAVRQVSGPSRRPSGTSLGVAGRTEINWCHKLKQMSFLKIAQRNQLVPCYGVRQLQGPEPRFGPSSQGLGLGLGGASSRVWGPAGLGWGVRGRAHGGLGPGPPGLGCLRPVFRRSEVSW